MNQPNPKLNIDIEGFTGPLDLLVHLIGKHEMDITTIHLAPITTSFLAVIREQDHKDLDMAGEYLILAATLVRYKSRALVPKDETEPEDEELADQLLEERRKEYERFRALADELKDREEVSSSLFPRLGKPPEGKRDIIEYDDISIYDLQQTFAKILAEIGEREPGHIEDETYSVDEKILELEALISHNKRIVLTDYLRSKESKVEIIVIFLALLEMIRLKEIKAVQDKVHGEIMLEATEKKLHVGVDIDEQEPINE